MNWKDFWNHSPQVRSGNYCRQVGRTLRNEPYSVDDVDRHAARLLGLLEPCPQHTLLDLGCGNGLVTSRIAHHFKTVAALDYSDALIATAKEHFARPNVRYLVGDALEVERTAYDRVLISGVFQYFEAAQGLHLLKRLRGIVPDDGRLVVGDVPDRDRLWNFYRGASGRCRYVLDLARDRPIIGRWWGPSALHALAQQSGWTLSIHYQPADLPNHYFRYDAVLEPA